MDKHQPTRPRTEQAFSPASAASPAALGLNRPRLPASTACKHRLQGIGGAYRPLTVSSCLQAPPIDTVFRKFSGARVTRFSRRATRRRRPHGHSARRADLGTHAIHAAQRRRTAGARQRHRVVESSARDGVQQPHQIRRSDFTPDRTLSVVDQLVRPQTTPAEVEAEGLNGFALLKSVAETDGSARLMKVGISSGWSMIDDAASSAAAQWKYEPALVDGKPVRSVIEYTLYFGKGSR